MYTFISVPMGTDSLTLPILTLSDNLKHAVSPLVVRSHPKPTPLFGVARINVYASPKAQAYWNLLPHSVKHILPSGGVSSNG